MQAMLMRSFLALTILTFFNASSLQAATERRIALVIGNSTYTSGPLKNPVNDATDLAANLRKLGFVVTLKKNANHQEMEEAIQEFGEQLKKGGVGLFFYAGHGVQISGRNYLLPIGAKINKELDVKFQAVDAEIVMAEMDNASNGLNIVILDACRDNPLGKSFRSASRGLAMISDAPKGTFITYSTSPGKVAADGSGRNSPYTESLIRHMTTPGIPIEEVFKIGCYKDDQTALAIFGISLPGRDINGFAVEGDNMTNELCISICKEKGFSYAGTQYSSQCFCGNEYGIYGKAQNCNMQCSGNSGQI
jgi:hypothetical protein